MGGLQFPESVADFFAYEFWHRIQESREVLRSVLLCALLHVCFIGLTRNCLQVREAVKTPSPNTVIMLEEGALWLGNEDIASNALFVRPCYPELLDTIAAYTAKRPQLKKGEIIVTGTPGKQILPVCQAMSRQCTQRCHSTLIHCTHGLAGLGILWVEVL